MLSKILVKLIDITLSIPLVFYFQQKYMNTYKPIKEVFSKYLNVKSIKILEIGCSTGKCSLEIIESFKDIEYTGIDIDSKYIEFAGHKNPLGKYLKMDAGQLEFSNDTFDVIMIIDVLHHLSDDTIKKCLLEASRVLKNDGVILTTDPVFTQDYLLSNILNSLDRGRNIRCCEAYEKLFKDLKVVDNFYRKVVFHRNVFFVLKKSTK